MIPFGRPVTAIPGHPIIVKSLDKVPGEIILIVSTVSGRQDRSTGASVHVKDPTDTFAPARHPAVSPHEMFVLKHDVSMCPFTPHVNVPVSIVGGETKKLHGRLELDPSGSNISLR